MAAYGRGAVYAAYGRGAVNGGPETYGRVPLSRLHCLLSTNDWPSSLNDTGRVLSS